MLKRALANFALVLAGCAAALLMLEVGLRVYSGVPVLSTANFVVQSLDLIRRNTGVMVFDELVGWRLSDDFGAGSSFTTTQHGVRRTPLVQSSLPHGAILAVGDSFTAGSGVKDAETWPAQLEQRLGRPVINAAAGAWGVDQMVLRAEQLAPIVKPAEIIVGIMAWDSFRNSYDMYGGGLKPWFQVTGGEPVLKGVPVPRLDASDVDLGWRRRLLGHSWLVHWLAGRLGVMDRWVTEPHRYRRVMSDEQGVAVTCALMKRLESLRQKHGSRIVVLMMWGAQDAREPQPHPLVGTPVMKCATAAGFDAVDTHPALHEAARGDAKRFGSLWIDENGVLGHPSPEGYAIVARLLHEQAFRVEAPKERGRPE